MFAAGVLSSSRRNAESESNGKRALAWSRRSSAVPSSFEASFALALAFVANVTRRGSVEPLGSPSLKFSTSRRAEPGVRRSA